MNAKPLNTKRFYYFCQMESNGQSNRNIGKSYTSIVYNVTTKVDWLIHDAWLKWMLDIHMPEVLGTGCFEKHSLVRILETDETEGPTYAVQYHAGNMGKYQQYLETYSAGLRKQVVEKWGSRIMAFHTLMGTVQ